MIFLLLTALAWLSTKSAQQGPVSKPVVRACADSWNDSAFKAKKNRPKKSQKGTYAESGACVELASSALEIQEYLQSYGRTQQWKITADQMNEDSWMFSLEVDKDELLRDTTEDSQKKRVEWAMGVIRVHVNTAQIPDGYARTIVRASFRGYGRPADQFAMEKEYWELDSNNNFENSIVSALRAHFTTAPSAGTPQAHAVEVPVDYPAPQFENGFFPLFRMDTSSGFIVGVFSDCAIFKEPSPQFPALRH
jgi:hypothetical protein